MKKILVAFFLALPLIAGAQSKHHFEIGGGYAAHTEMLEDEKTREEKSTLGAFAEYRFDITDMISLGAQYFFAPSHRGGTVGHSSDVPTVTFNTRIHTANLLAEFKLASKGTLIPFAAVGGGVQCRYMFMNTALYPDYYWTPDLYLRFGFQAFDHLRVSVGHFHDLHIPFKDLPRSAPCYFLAASWSF